MGSSIGLMRSSRRIRDLICPDCASSDDLIVSKTLDGVITSWNPAAERILGYTADEAIGKYITLVIRPDRWSEEDDGLARIGRGERVDR